MPKRRREVPFLAAAGRCWVPRRDPQSHPADCIPLLGMSALGSGLKCLRCSAVKYPPCSERAKAAEEGASCQRCGAGDAIAKCRCSTTRNSRQCNPSRPELPSAIPYTLSPIPCLLTLPGPQARPAPPKTRLRQPTSIPFTLHNLSRRPQTFTPFRVHTSRDQPIRPKVC